VGEHRSGAMRPHVGVRTGGIGGKWDLTSGMFLGRGDGAVTVCPWSRSCCGAGCGGESAEDREESRLNPLCQATAVLLAALMSKNSFPLLYTTCRTVGDNVARAVLAGSPSQERHRRAAPKGRHRKLATPSLNRYGALYTASTT